MPNRIKNQPNLNSGHPENPHPYVDIQPLYDKGVMLPAIFLVTETK
jgi:hypothetical protein